VQSKIEAYDFENIVVLFYVYFDAISCAGSSDIIANEVENNQRILLWVIIFYLLKMCYNINIIVRRV
jgi:hypothetical protein